MHHPAKDDGIKAAAGLFALSFCRNGARQAEFSPIRTLRFVPFWHTQIRVQVPVGYTQGDTLI